MDCTGIKQAAARAVALAALGFVAVPDAGALERLFGAGRWQAIGEVIVYRGRVWFADGIPWLDHNAADVYSLDPASGAARYERHLMSQDAGTPVVSAGLLYWPFEDSRFSAGRGEYMVTDGERWRWGELPGARAFHVHTMADAEGVLFAAASAWRATLHRSHDRGHTWEVVYSHPTPPGRVSRITSLATLAGRLYAGMRSEKQDGTRLFRLDSDTLVPVPGWPAGQDTRHLTVFDGWLYAVNRNRGAYRLLRTDGRRVEPVEGLDASSIRALHGGERSLRVALAETGGGRLLASPDGRRFEVEHRFDGEQPVSIAEMAGQVFVGTARRGGAGALWGPRPARAATSAPPPELPAPERRPVADPAGALRALDAALEPAADYGAHRRHLLAALDPIVASGDPTLGEALSERLDAPHPDAEIDAIGGNYRVRVGRANRWLLLRSIAAIGHGRIPRDLLEMAWDETPNPPEKYFHPLPGAAWAAGAIGQDDPGSIDALVAGLGRAGEPDWVDGDRVGALTALTGQRFAYDFEAWREWWHGRRREMAWIPPARFDMGSNDADAEPAEGPVHDVTVDGFWLDRLETTNAGFAEFVAATGYVTDAERAGEGWHWVRGWGGVAGANWRHPHGPDTHVDDLGRHPVVQVSWNDARAYCAWRGKRLPTEAEWERAARAGDGRRHAWGDEPPGAGARASYGTDRCCAASDDDGHRFTAPVGSFPAGTSPFGVLDLTGNVWEWTEDVFGLRYYARSPPRNPVNRGPGAQRVIRGGGWGNNPWGLRATLRHANPPDAALSMVGFRCAH